MYLRVTTSIPLAILPLNCCSDYENRHEAVSRGAPTVAMLDLLSLRLAKLLIPSKENFPKHYPQIHAILQNFFGVGFHFGDRPSLFISH
jgi:hypothetical protein